MKKDSALGSSRFNITWTHVNQITLRFCDFPIQHVPGQSLFGVFRGLPRSSAFEDTQEQFHGGHLLIAAQQKLARLGILQDIFVLLLVFGTKSLLATCEVMS